jgi:hypothetical protein
MKWSPHLAKRGDEHRYVEEALTELRNGRYRSSFGNLERKDKY